MLRETAGTRGCVMRFFSTEEVPTGQRLAYWSALASEAIAPMSVDVGRSSTAIQGRLWAHKIGAIDIVRACSTSVVLRRTPTEIARMKERCFLVTISEDARFLVRGKGYEAELRPNDFILYDLTQPGLTIHSGCTALNVLIPEGLLRRHLPSVDDLNGTIVRCDRGAGLIVATMIRALAPNKEPLNGCAADHVCTALLHAIAAACAEAHDIPISPETASGSRRDQIVHFVEGHLYDADLSIVMVAAAFGVSDRYVRMLFERGEEPLSAYIRRRRFEECARQLRDPLQRSRTISEIALSCGFNSLASFDRAFKAHFDMTPREYRTRGE